MLNAKTVNSVSGGLLVTVRHVLCKTSKLYGSRPHESGDIIYNVADIIVSFIIKANSNCLVTEGDL